ncbi:flavoprotein [Streptomyces sp. TS71-3]|uniref:flavoprotein n=1 Tax=Streptomyces sp. TS71-3 TaxID=2733862 RepID=UPI001B0B03DE|nr:flavoprotein [Streptomyces sp. TS71-3]GHJ40859.1 flavoprotein [Streptomyces sp. TS71-3]
MRTLYLIACAAEPAQYVDEGVRQAQSAGWDVCVVLTPSAARWWQPRMTELVELTGHPVRSQYKLPWEPDVLPKADAMVVAPLSCTSLNKWGNGIADTLALGLASEAVNLGVPVAAVPYFNEAQAAQPAVRRSVEALRAQGVRYLDGSERPGGAGSAGAGEPPAGGMAFPWHLALAAVDGDRG